MSASTFFSCFSDFPNILPSILNKQIALLCYTALITHMIAASISHRNKDGLSSSTKQLHRACSATRSIGFPAALCPNSTHAPPKTCYHLSCKATLDEAESPPQMRHLFSESIQKVESVRRRHRGSKEIQNELSDITDLLKGERIRIRLLFQEIINNNTSLPKSSTSLLRNGASLPKSSSACTNTEAIILGGRPDSLVPMAPSWSRQSFHGYKSFAKLAGMLRCAGIKVECVLPMSRDFPCKDTELNELRSGGPQKTPTRKEVLQIQKCLLSKLSNQARFILKQRGLQAASRIDQI